MIDVGGLVAALVARGAVSGDPINQAPAAPAANRITPPIRRAGRFTPMPQP